MTKAGVYNFLELNDFMKEENSVDEWNGAQEQPVLVIVGMHDPVAE